MKTGSGWCSNPLGGNATSVHQLTLNVICHGEVCQAFYLDALLFNAECQQGWARFKEIKEPF